MGPQVHGSVQRRCHAMNEAAGMWERGGMGWDWKTYLVEEPRAEYNLYGIVHD